MEISLEGEVVEWMYLAQDVGRPLCCEPSVSINLTNSLAR
jgi:hypothetical protein